jgi:hypothetical protein
MIRLLPLRRATLAVPLAFAALAALAPVTAAQSIWLDRVSPKTLHLEIARPLYEDGEDIDFMTANWTLSGRFPVSASLHLVGELPFARIGFDSALDEESSSTIGNLYAGIETHPAGGSGAWFEGGVRVPTSSDNELATISGTLVDADRWEAYGLLSEAFVLHTAAHWRSDPVGKVGVDLRVAPNLWLGGELADDAELFVVYGGQVLYHGTSVRGGAGLTGRWLATEDDDDSSTQQFEAAVDVLSGRVRPGVTLRIPLDEDEFLQTDAVIGVSLNVLLD